MNIIELVRKILTECPLMGQFTNHIHVDFTENTDGNFGLYATGDSLVKEDILGNQERQHSFVLYAHYQSLNDFDRMSNSTFLLDLAQWLETVEGYEIRETVNGIEKTGELISLTSANGMLYGVPTGDMNDGVTYQLQIYARYTLNESEV